MPGGNGAARLVTDQAAQRLQRLSAQMRIVLRVGDADAVHDLRVAIRRLLQAIATFETWFVSPERSRIRRQLVGLLTTAGAVRDCDIALEILNKLESRNAGKIGDALHSRRQAAARRLAALLRRWTNQRRTSVWRAKLAVIETPAASDGQSWGELARRELPRLAKEFFRLGQRAVKSRPSARGLHQLRIEAKKLRYTLEMFEPTYPAAARDCISSLHDLQMVLGKISDVRTTRKLIDDLGGGRKLEAMLRKKQRKRITAFGRHWERQFSADQIKEWIHFLRQPLRKPVMRSESAATGKRAAS